MCIERADYGKQSAAAAMRPRSAPQFQLNAHVLGLREAEVVLSPPRHDREIAALLRSKKISQST